MTVTQLINRTCQAGKSLNGNLRKQACERNSLLAGMDVHWLFRQSIVDLETGRHGIRWLIFRILRENKAEFPLFQKQEDRLVYVNFGLTTRQIIDRVRAHNGYDKYPDKTILHYLGVIMKQDGQVASIRMNNQEDPANGNRKVPRKKWYLIAE